MKNDINTKENAVNDIVKIEILDLSFYLVILKNKKMQ